MACLSELALAPWASHSGFAVRRRRAGSFVIEAIVAVLLLATASLAVVRLARSSVDLQLRSDREMAATLTAQNVLTQLDATASDQLAESIADIERSFGERSGCDVSISIHPFDRDGVAGLHLRVEVTAGDQARVELHDWRLDEQRDGEQGDGEQRDGGEPNE